MGVGGEYKVVCISDGGEGTKFISASTTPFRW
jgi:hypothetical protein